MPEIKTYNEKDLVKADMFRDGCIYLSRVPFVTFYQKFSGHDVVGSFRGTPGMDAGIYVREIVDGQASPEEMQELCFGWLVNLLRVDGMRENFKDKIFVPGEEHDEAVQEYVDRDTVHFTKYSNSKGPFLSFGNFVSLEDSLRGY